MNIFTKVTAAIMLMMLVAASCHKPDGPNNGGNNDTIGEHAYVDLGLPSGTLWATCNLGADTPEDYGDYFAWGETAHKEIYDWKVTDMAVFSMSGMS